jgi:hypothetical protein
MITSTYRAVAAMLVGLVAIAGISACSDDDDTAAPAAFTSPVDGKQYCAWINSSHECDQSAYPPMPFAIPQDQPTQTAGMSNTDYLLLGGLFGYAMGHHSYYYSPFYYDHYIHPAYVRYPGYVSYGYGHVPTQRITNVNVYKTTVINHADTKYAAQEKSFAANPKYGTYKTANGKSISATKLPNKPFSNSNVPVSRKAGGDAPYSSPSKSKSGFSSRSSSSHSGRGRK